MASQRLAVVIFLAHVATVTSEAATVKPDCTRPPYCHKWWLSGNQTTGTVSAVFTVVLAVILIVLVAAVACLAFMVVSRHCYSAVSGCCCTPGDYQLVQQHDRGDIEIEALSTPRRRGSGRPWCNLFLACCCGVCLAVPAIAGGAVYWWRVSGSPPLAGLAITNFKAKAHASQKQGHADHAGSKKQKKSGSNGAKNS